MGYFRYLWKFLFWGLIVLVLLATLLPLLPSSRWYVRMWDYPRLQTLVLAVLAMVLFYVFYYRRRKRGRLLMLVLLGVVVYQAVKAFPYTPFASKQVQQSEGDAADTTTLSLLVSNVLQFNQDHEKLLNMVRELKPDLLLTLESDSVWEKALDQLQPAYPYVVRIPKSNTYGMHLYSRLPLQQTKVLYLLEPDIPSIQTQLRLRSGHWVQLYAVHPRPPVPGESNDSRERDAEIVMVGKMAKAARGAVLVVGDFNDVAWSPSSKLFQEVSGLLDPRIGRGFYSTFHAQYPMFRWPLDHVFQSNHFKLVQMKRLPDIGSDHFPMFVQLSYEPAEKEEQPEVQTGRDTAREANRIIEKGQNDKDAPGE